MKRLILLIFMLVAFSSLRGQSIFRGVLINTRDSSAIPFAVIKLVEANNTILADSTGQFTFALPNSNIKVLTFNVSVLGYKTVIHHTRTFTKIEKVYLEVGAYDLSEAHIVGLSAEDIVHRAVAAIPTNYESSSYFAYSSYRQYQHINGAAVNLVEAQPVVMFKLKKDKKEIVSDESFACRQVRRTMFFENPSNQYKDNVADLMTENPIYHLSHGSIADNKLYSYVFNYDTTYDSPDYYVINYSCRHFSSETHGIADPAVQQAFHNEAYESGQLIIDRETLAFARVQRKSIRNPDYVYPYFSQLNFVYPKKEYFYEFNNAELIAEYELTDSKWRLKTLCRQYTDNFFNAGWGNKIYTISDVFEWRCDSISRSITGDLVNNFHPKLTEYGPYTYDTTFWKTNDFPFYFHNKEAIWKDLSRFGTIEQQFYKQGILEANNH